MWCVDNNRNCFVDLEFVLNRLIQGGHYYNGDAMLDNSEKHGYLKMPGNNQPNPVNVTPMGKQSV